MPLTASSNASSWKIIGKQFASCIEKTLATFVISDTITHSHFPGYFALNRLSKWSPLDADRMVPRTEYPLSRRLFMAQTAMKPLAPVTRTLSPGRIVVIFFDDVLGKEYVFVEKKERALAVIFISFRLRIMSQLTTVKNIVKNRKFAYQGLLNETLTEHDRENLWDESALIAIQSRMPCVMSQV